MADSSTITALAAVGGSLVGGLSSFATSYFTQRNQGRRERLAKELERRETLYGDFIDKAANLFMDAMDKELDEPGKLVGLVAVPSRITLTGSPEIVAAAEAVLQELLAAYGRPAMTPSEAFGRVRAELSNPLRVFTQACRDDRETMLRAL